MQQQLQLPAAGTYVGIPKATVHIYCMYCCWSTGYQYSTRKSFGTSYTLCQVKIIPTKQPESTRRRSIAEVRKACAKARKKWDSSALDPEGGGDIEQGINSL